MADRPGWRDELAATFTEPATIMLKALDHDASTLHTGPNQEVVLDSWARGPVLLIGDAPRPGDAPPGRADVPLELRAPVRPALTGLPSAMIDTRSPTWGIRAAEQPHLADLVSTMEPGTGRRVGS
ncbi:hypothetical protein AB0B85_29210 [Micromonospora sp. NPDC049044]|uniref:hypothetical protein n=1 Tax=Micromonospora sp. NPDC049044 TaxID=3154827 RepID=UPI003405EA0F